MAFYSSTGATKLSKKNGRTATAYAHHNFDSIFSSLHINLRSKQGKDAIQLSFPLKLQFECAGIEEVFWVILTFYDVAIKSSSIQVFECSRSSIFALKLDKHTPGSLWVLNILCSRDNNVNNSAIRFTLLLNIQESIFKLLAITEHIICHHVFKKNGCTRAGMRSFFDCNVEVISLKFFYEKSFLTLLVVRISNKEGFLLLKNCSQNFTEQ
mmetsp:Transcript_35090/g.39821  ORF Transcript_35090/g.39821 Transcript_35090/m.39821 type:complete len:211 (+) Transcript_35090:67-699(+)